MPRPGPLKLQVFSHPTVPPGEVFVLDLHVIAELFERGDIDFDADLGVVCQTEQVAERLKRAVGKIEAISIKDAGDKLAAHLRGDPE